MHGIDGGRLDKLRRSLPPTLLLISILSVFYIPYGANIRTIRMLLLSNNITVSLFMQ